MSASSPELLALRKVTAGRYSIEYELGRGGMGVVFLARDLALERPVAIKLLPLSWSDDERMRERFVREARTAARLSHPNIVPIHSVEEHSDAVFFVMGYVDGETLSARVRRAGPLDAHDGSTLVQELAWALAYAHSAGVIHRDVKPDNVMIDRASGRAMLTDFGIARLGDDASGRPEGGEIVGTAQFLSPEQASGVSVDGRSDLYSLGVTAFYALAGRLPFESSTATGLIAMHLMQPAPAVASVRASLPERLCVAIDRCLAKSPADRFATGEQLADAIAVARAAEVQVAPPVRAFLRDRTRMANELALLFFAAQYFAAFAHVPAARVLVPLGALGVASVARLFRTARRLLGAGFGFRDVRIALEEDATDRREELGVAHLTHAGEARLHKAAQMRAAGIVSMVMGGLAVASFLENGRFTPLLLGGAAVVGGGFLIHVAGPMPPRAHRQQMLSRWFDRLWEGRLGEWFFAVASAPDSAPFRRLLGAAGLTSHPSQRLTPALDAAREIEHRIDAIVEAHELPKPDKRSDVAGELHVNTPG
jgi:eukaryotic-like serine/threonine-protein kinase